MATAEGSDSTTRQMEDAELAARIRAGDREALQAVVHALHETTRDAIDGCLEYVSTQKTMAFVLREIEGLATEEICKILEVTRTNLRTPPLGVCNWAVRVNR